MRSRKKQEIMEKWGTYRVKRNNGQRLFRTRRNRAYEEDVTSWELQPNPDSEYKRVLDDEDLWDWLYPSYIRGSRGRGVANFSIQSNRVEGVSAQSRFISSVQGVVGESQHTRAPIDLIPVQGVVGDEVQECIGGRRVHRYRASLSARIFRFCPDSLALSFREAEECEA